MKNSFIFIGFIALVFIFVGGCIKKELESENKTIATQYVDKIWNDKEFNEIDNLLSVDFVNHSPFPGMSQDRESLKQFIALSSKTFPDGHYTIEDMIAEGKKVMMRGSFKGTHQGVFMGVPGTGNQITMTWIIVLSIENGKIIERWAEYDGLGMNLQAGFKLVPPEEVTIEELKTAFDSTCILYNAGNLDAYFGYMHDDVVYYTDYHNHPIEGKINVRALYDGVFLHFDSTHWESTDPKFVVSGTTGIVWSPYIHTMIKKGQAAVIGKGRHIETFTKENGKWLKISEHMSHFPEN